jgi:uncharacterized protein (TIGR03083 family)
MPIGARMDTWGKYDGERTALVEDLAGLEPSQWDVQSLCSEWKVRHVVAHLVHGSEVGSAFFIGLLKSGMSFNRYMARKALAAGAASPDVLLAGLKESIGKHTAPPMAKPVNMLIDTVCHSADIRRPLGIGRSLPDETLVAVADGLNGLGFPLATKRRITGLRLVANDVAWSSGTGPEVGGPIESLILVMAGRPAGLGDLTGDGTTLLRSRM